ncbi:MAG: SDR family NAD(P)-dependent oxidoreductase [Planctomycetaceae bacterium]|jgi:short-subunit dehydrogenase|nr:SDR family NAD(P)-dependent oxidoreductase [Planctomycetaceae bacterium]
MKHRIHSSRVLLTGASSGIGNALARLLAAKGADIVVTARREKLLDELIAGVHRDNPEYGNGSRKIVSIAGDICDSEVRKRCITVAQEQLGGVDILINNAGVGATALAMETPDEIFRRMMEVNYFSLIQMTQAAFPLLQESASNKERQNDGICPIVINIGSIVGLRGVPHYSAYGASKFAVTCFSDVLRAEFAAKKIDVLHVSPGTTQTEFFDSLLMSGSVPDFPIHPKVTAEYVAKKIIRAIERGKHRIIPYIPAVVLALIQRFSPRLTDTIMERYVQKHQ